MSKQDELKRYADLAISLTKDKTDAAIARSNMSSRSQIRFSQSAIDILKRWETQTMELFVVVDGEKTGFSQRAISNEDDVRSLVADSIAFAKLMPESQFYAGIETEVKKYTEPKKIYDDKIDDYHEIAPGMVNAAIDKALQEGAKRVAGALLFGKELQFLRTSSGFEGLSKKTNYDLNVRAFQDELDYSGQGITCGTIPSKAEEAMIEAGREAGELSKRANGAIQGAPGTYDLVMNPTVAANVIGYLPGAANPFLVLIGMSPLGDKIGQQVGPDFVTASDNPHMPEGMASRGFDVEGTPTQNIDIIDNGIFKHFTHNTSTARMYETETTGSSEFVGLGQGLRMLLPDSSNIVFNEGDYTLEELLESDKPTIYVTSNWYTRWQNYQTGEFSTIPRDATFFIENGEMKPIKNIRISDNMLRMFKNISAMGKDRKQIYWWEVYVPTFIPSIKVSDVRITAATQ
ncbi:MAG: Zinc-dependent protease [Candidatus Thorarchaeota archaeon]|nr:MAG: Zinc-dependent protease [Candidatus Thorarchaeota archaeon]